MLMVDNRIPPNSERLSLEEMRAQGNGATAGACSRCGCRHQLEAPVESSYLVDQGMARKRRRVCRNCGQEVFRTTEVVVPDGHKIKIVPEDETA